MLSCWGRATEGQTGAVGPDVRRPHETQKGAQELAAGGSVGCARLMNGGVACCVRHATGISCFGRNQTGQLGVGTTEDSAVPVSVAGFSR